MISGELTPSRAVKYIVTDLLGIKVDDFAETFAAEFGKEESTGRSYLYGAPMNKSGPQLYDLLSKSVLNYIKKLEEQKQTSQAKEIRNAWEKNLKKAKTIIKLAYFDKRRMTLQWENQEKEDEQRKNILAQMQPFFFTLSPPNGYKYYRNFDGYAMLTSSDCAFLTFLSNIPPDILSKFDDAIDSTKCEIDLKEQFDLVTSSLGQWLEIRDRNNRDNCKNGNNALEDTWKGFCRKANDIPPYTLRMIFNYLHMETSANPPTKAHINLLLKYKFFMCSEYQSFWLEQAKELSLDIYNDIKR